MMRTSKPLAGRTKNFLHSCSHIVSDAGAAHLIVDYGHIKIAQLLEGICQVGVRLSHLGIQQDAAVIEGNALLVLTQLVVNGTDQQQQICSVGVLRVDL